MLKNEARWIGQQLSRLSSQEISPVLNVGSATAEFREQVQPWIDQMIFRPLRQRGVEIQYTDVSEGAGVDITGDLDDDAFFKILSARRYRTVLCCNLLEHVADPQRVCTKLEQLLLQNGYMVVTVPRRFPYHPDPIDTMFRPTPEEIDRLFPHCRLVEGQIVDCGTGWDYVDRDARVLIDKLKQRLRRRHEYGGVTGSTSFGPWLLRHFHQSCAVLQKQNGALNVQT
jgi:SAM-dependent methyltransferase